MIVNRSYQCDLKVSAVVLWVFDCLFIKCILQGWMPDWGGLTRCLLEISMSQWYVC